MNASISPPARGGSGRALLTRTGSGSSSLGGSGKLAAGELIAGADHDVSRLLFNTSVQEDRAARLGLG